MTEPSNRSKLWLPALAVGGLSLACCCGGLLGGPREPSKVSVGEVATADAGQLAAREPTEVNSDAAATVAEQTKPPSPWEAPTTVVLRDKASDLEDQFWPLFDDLSEKRAEDAVETLKAAQPATWQDALAGTKAKAAEDRKSARARVLSTTYVLPVPDLDELPQYDSAKGAFPLVVPGVFPMARGLLGGASGWSVALDKAPRSARTESSMPDRNGGTLVRYSYAFEGGTPRTLPIAVGAAEADAFYGRHSGRLAVDLLVTVSGGHVDRGGPEYKLKSDGSISAEVLKNATANAGRAIVVRVVAWRVRSGRDVLAIDPAPAQ